MTLTNPHPAASAASAAPTALAASTAAASSAAPAAPPTQGLELDLASLSSAARQRVFEEAFDYRGDVTLHLTDGTALEGYVFDRRTLPGTSQTELRIMPAQGGGKRTISAETIQRIAFTGKDTAAGKTWENWVRRYVEKRLAGERAEIESEKLD
ncbi:MAG: hypothetical protein U0636_05415 [Phycisphaerales bacterium]